MGDVLLSIRNLKTYFFTTDGTIKAVDDVSFDIHEEEVVGLIGESGSGKSTLGLSIVRLVPPPGRIVGGSVVFKGEDLMRKSEKEMKEIRGSKISICFQNPLTYLNPVMKIGDQIAEVLVKHENMGKEDALKKAMEIMDVVGLSPPEKRIDSYPHQLSGGQRQRVLLAIALACSPELLIADEPTTSVDVITQAKILGLLKKIKSALKTSILLITHDLSIIAQLSDRVAVLYSGKLMEYADVEEIYENPLHPYTEALLNSIVDIGFNGEWLKAIRGMIPDPTNPPSGCRFHPRCPYAQGRCSKQEPPTIKTGRDRLVSCFRYE